MITLRNDHHKTAATIRPRHNRLGIAAIRRLKMALCGSADCPCSGATGARGPNAHWLTMMGNGTWAIVQPNPIAASLAALRTATGTTQDQAARAIGRTAITWSRWERGLHDPSLEDLRRIAELFEVTPAHLLTG